MRIALTVALLLLIACTPAGSGGSTPVPEPDRSPSAFETPTSLPFAAASPSAFVVAQAQISRDMSVDPPRGFRDHDNGGSQNVVNVENERDGRFRARGSAVLDRIRGDPVTPVNVAEARSRCTDCQAIAVAVQVALYRRGANAIVPINRAVALNEDCTRCVTVARAVQYVIPLDDISRVPGDVDELVRRVDREAEYFERIKDLENVDPAEAEGRLNQLVADFATLHQHLSNLIDRKEDSTSPTPSPTALLTPSPSAVTTRTPETPVPIGSPAAKP